MSAPSTSSAAAAGIPRFSGRGHTIGGANSSKQTDVVSLEYVTFRVPYEEMNMKFRHGQKEMDKAAANVARASAMITELTSHATTTIPKEQLVRKFDFLMKQVRDAKLTMERVCQEQLDETEKIKKRCAIIESEITVKPDEEPRRAAALERQRFGRYVVWHMLRCGYIKTARGFVDELKLHDMIDIELFENIHDIEKTISAGDIAPALEWIERHRHKLRKIGSRLEIVLRQLEVVALIEQNSVHEAILYVKKWITPIAKAQHSEDLKKTMCAIACTYEQSKARFPDLHDPKRFEKAAAFYIKEVYRVYQIKGATALTILLQCGIAAFKTPSCHNDEKTPLNKQRCFVCRPDIWPLAEKLPYAHVANSRILCSMTDELCNDEDNKPYMFPSGHVFGAKAIEKLRRDDNKVWDPVHKQLIDETEVLRLYFL